MFDSILDILLPFLQLAFGIGLLWKGSFSLIEYSLKIGKQLNLSELFIGITLLAWATSLPEIFVLINSIIFIKSDPSSAMYGTIIGSNFANISLVLGLGVLFSSKHFIAKAENFSTRFTIIFFATLCLVGYPLIKSTNNQLALLLSLLMTGSMILYIFTSYNKSSVENVAKIKPRYKQLARDAGALIASICVIYFGAFCVTSLGKILMETFEVSSATIGGLFFALSTSAPEIFTSLVAIIKFKKSTLVLGNVLGSNIANIFGFGLISLFYNINIGSENTLLASGGLLLGAEILAFLLCICYLKNNEVRIPYWLGLFLIVIYYLFVRIV